ncbi:MAG: HEAT repeat domain-containing protein [Cyclobacteriaceae bacterium]
MEAKNIKTLLDRYYDGDTTLVEEKQLQTYFSQDDIPVDLWPDRDHFQAFANLQTEEPDEAIGYDRFFQKIEAQEHVAQERETRWKLWGGRIAASVALALAGFMGGIWYGQEATTTEVAALREEFQDMRQTMLFNQMQQASASERIQAIQASHSSAKDDQTVSEALLLTLRSDPNVNVRLAAIEALGSFSDQAQMRSALARTLNEQDHPMVQIAIINQLVTWGEKEAVPQLQQLVQNEAVNEVVKQQAEYGISQLML